MGNKEKYVEIKVWNMKCKEDGYMKKGQKMKKNM
jgi:hypothetical protein